MSDSSHSRQHYRLRYPLTARPRMSMEGTDFTVTELSEEGCRIEGNEEQAFLFRNRPNVIFSFRNGTVVKSSAVLFRATEVELILNLFPSIPPHVIMAEQQWIIQKFPRTSE